MEFLTITCKNSSVSWMPVRDQFSARLNTVTLRRSFNNSTGCLSAYALSLKSFWSPLKALQGSAPKYLTDLISVLPPSSYDLRRNNKGILSTSERFTKVTMEDRDRCKGYDFWLIIASYTHNQSSVEWSLSSSNMDLSYIHLQPCAKDKIIKGKTQPFSHFFFFRKMPLY